MSLPTPYQNIIHLSRYARLDRKRGRRETWEETSARYLNYMAGHLLENHNYEATPDVLAQLDSQMMNLGALPSMRTMMAAGPMLDQDHLAGYNCAYLPVDSPRAFDEALYLLMCTCGVGFSVERQFVARLPLIPQRFRTDPSAHIDVPDTRIGWAQSYAKLIEWLYKGIVPTYTTERVRGKGAILKTTGGTASGPEPLERLFQFTIAIFEGARGRRLTSLECHDMMCHVADIVMVGGIRQAAMISLSNLSDQRMRGAKMGNWFEGTPWRRLANNSVAYTEIPTPGDWMSEWLALYNSKSGERGIFNRVAAQRKAASLGRATHWPNGDEIEFGCNPCGEIDLRPNGLCNLSEAVARAGDTPHTLEDKVVAATIFGTWQSTLTKFRHLRKRWRQNCEEERLLGVSITGIMDCPLINRVTKEARELLNHLRQVVWHTNKEWAERLDIPVSKAMTCVKPSGTVSQLTDASSGIHARYAKHYIRRINMNRSLAVTKFLVANGLPHVPHITKPNDVLVFEFPVAAPRNAVVEGDRTAIETLEHWRMFRKHWTDHNPSTTVTVSEREWPAVGGWVYSNMEDVGGLAFFPASNAVYQQAPLEAITEQQYKELDAAMPEDLPWDELESWERGKPITDQRRPEFACTADVCERN